MSFNPEVRQRGAGAVRHCRSAVLVLAGAADDSKRQKHDGWNARLFSRDACRASGDCTRIIRVKSNVKAPNRLGDILDLLSTHVFIVATEFFPDRGAHRI